MGCTHQSIPFHCPSHRCIFPGATISLPLPQIHLHLISISTTQPDTTISCIFIPQHLSIITTASFPSLQRGPSHPLHLISTRSITIHLGGYTIPTRAIIFSPYPDSTISYPLPLFIIKGSHLHHLGVHHRHHLLHQEEGEPHKEREEGEGTGTAHYAGTISQLIYPA